MAPFSPLFLVCLLASLPSALAGSANFPVKSTNLDAADTIAFYNGLEFTSNAATLEDPHPVHGIETSDGGFVFVGKALECRAQSGNEASNCATGQDGTKTEAWAIKINPGGTANTWTWRSGHAGKNDIANSVAQLPNGDILVAGYRVVGGVAKRSVTKLALADGQETWTATDFGDGPETTKNGAWETITIDATNGNVMLGGLKLKPDQTEMSFKSYGNCAGGQSSIVLLPVAAFAAATAPTTATTGFLEWAAGATGDEPNWNTVKKCDATAAGDVVCLLWRDAVTDKGAGLVKLPKTSATATWTPTWGPNMYGDNHGEGTDMVVLADGSGFAISGHGAKNTAGTAISGALFGRITKVNAAGAWQWSKAFGSCGSDNPTTVCGTPFIKNEVWGLQESSDGGLVFACG